MLSAAHMQSLPHFFADIPDPRRTQGRRHSLCTVLAIAASSCLSGMRGCKAMADWAKALSQKARGRFGCRQELGRLIVPSESIIRNVLIRVDPVCLDRALTRLNEVYGKEDESLAIDGKTMCNAIDIEGKDVTADALLAQRDIASYVVGRKAHHHFTVKGNQPTILQDVALYFKNRREPDFVDCAPADHGRTEIRKDMDHDRTE